MRDALEIAKEMLRISQGSLFIEAGIDHDGHGNPIGPEQWYHYDLCPEGTVIWPLKKPRPRNVIVHPATKELLVKRTVEDILSNKTPPDICPF